MSGKPGRPPEDRLGRQHEIFLAVAPLIERHGAKRLTMRQAARAAHLSLGGLYHYFPTKRDLVLHALKPEAVGRLCAEFHGRHAGLERSDPWRYVQADVAYMTRQCFFLRPAFHAALELDAEVAWDHIQASIEGGLDSCTRPLGYALPQCTPEEIHRLGRSVRRAFFSALIDRTVTPDELRQELLSLIHGWPATVHQEEQPERPRVMALTQLADRRQMTG
jgi:AcrR family transcriptional regulator